MADGKHSTELTATPWKTRAAIKDPKVGDAAHQIDVPINRNALTRYTGRFPQRIAVGLANTDPTPIPIMYSPVVSETRAVATP